jgi:hypothetical protein
MNLDLPGWFSTSQGPQRRTEVEAAVEAAVEDSPAEERGRWRG